MKKIGKDDPHFAFANMLCDVGCAKSDRRPQMFFPDDPISQFEERRRSPDMEQIVSAIPQYFPPTDLERSTCGDCENFDKERGWCRETAQGVTSGMPSCDDWFIPRFDDGEDVDE